MAVRGREMTVGGPWLALRMVRGVGPVVYQGLLRAFGEPAAVFTASMHALECAGVRPEVARAIRGFDDWARGRGAVGAAARVRRDAGDLERRQLSAEPLRRSTTRRRSSSCTASCSRATAWPWRVVGSRNVSAYGLRMTRELTEGLVRYGVTVVSGLARGTDAQAHWTTLRAGGRTIAVMGSGIDVVYPSEHHALFQAIAEQGAVVTELPMGTQPDAENFPESQPHHQRFGAGDGVVEAAEKSGSLITAMLRRRAGARGVCRARRRRRAHARHASLDPRRAPS